MDKCVQNCYEAVSLWPIAWGCFAIVAVVCYAKVKLAGKKWVE